MRRKFVVVLSVFLTVLILSATLAGCGKPAKNAEYEEFAGQNGQGRKAN